MLESGSHVYQSKGISENPTNSTNQSDFAAENTAFYLSQPNQASEGNLKTTNEDAFLMDAGKWNSLKYMNIF